MSLKINKTICHDEPLIFEIGNKEKESFFVPDSSEIKAEDLPKELQRENIDLPNLSEPEIARHFTRLSKKNYSLDLDIYPLGSCTMKYNPKINEVIARTSSFASHHPMLEDELSQGSLKIIHELENHLCRLTGMDAFSLQPCAGAHGELAGMKMIAAYHKHNKSNKTKVLIPDTAHGTNPASAALCGYNVVQIKSNDKGTIDLEDLNKKMDKEVACIMITNPNTLGIFESDICEISKIIHEQNALVYMDGANFNAIIGIANIAKMGIDVLHLNLHKTFSTPHGGGGPGSGPVGVTSTLKQFLPIPIIKTDSKANLYFDSSNPNTIGKVSTFYGNFGVLLRALSYIYNVGNDGFSQIAENAVLNASYIKAKLEKVLHLPFAQNTMHECVFSDASFKEYGVTTMDFAKRLLDYGTHAPTVFFPLIVHGAIMIEPCETESKRSLDNFINVVYQIIDEIKDNPEFVKKAPHNLPIKRLDEVVAARKPIITYKKKD
ncbi:MAG: aminomethyl-transferring glycine dehydrogenase subunit GcvPB [Pseudomonadota bacterium]